MSRPARTRHRRALPLRLLGFAGALLLILGLVVVAGSAYASSQPNTSDDSSPSSASVDGPSGSPTDDDSGGSGESGDDKARGAGDSGSGPQGDREETDKEGEANGEDDQKNNNSGKNSDKNAGDDQKAEAGDQRARDTARAARSTADPLNRDKIGKAAPDDYVDITDVPATGNRGEGGAFTAGSYSVDCGVSDHRNSDNYMAAPGTPNGAQHTHDYVGNTSTNAFSGESSLEQASTSCASGDKSVFFWPVVRDLRGIGADANADGGGLDGNVGRILAPRSAQLTFSGHGDQPVTALPEHLMLITGNAKAKSQGGANENAKYTCSGFTDRVTDKYPVCPSGSKLMRFLDFPSCWDGANLDSKDLRSHVSFPDSGGNCTSDQTPIPALRITLTYDQPPGRNFSMDSFPDQQHDPSTDHADFENMSGTGRAEDGARCINDGRRCSNL